MRQASLKQSGGKLRGGKSPYISLFLCALPDMRQLSRDCDFQSRVPHIVGIFGLRECCRPAPGVGIDRSPFKSATQPEQTALAVIRQPQHDRHIGRVTTSLITSPYPAQIESDELHVPGRRPARSIEPGRNKTLGKTWRLPPLEITLKRASLRARSPPC
jgi:hypothetical protein